MDRTLLPRRAGHGGRGSREDGARARRLHVPRHHPTALERLIMAKMGYVGMNKPLLEAIERLTGLSRNDIRRVNISLAGDDLPRVEVILTLDASKTVDFMTVLAAIRTGGMRATYDHQCGDECMWA